jgi:hypothetical protein
MIRGSAQTEIDALAKFAAVCAGNADGFYAEGPGKESGAQNVIRIAAGGDGEQDVSVLCQGFDLSREDVFKAVIVSNGSEGRGVAGQGDGRECATFDAVATDEFCSHMLGVRGTAAVTDDHQAVAAMHGVSNDGGSLCDAADKFIVRAQCVDDGEVIRKHGLDGDLSGRDGCEGHLFSGVMEGGRQESWEFSHEARAGAIAETRMIPELNRQIATRGVHGIEAGCKQLSGLRQFEHCVPLREGERDRARWTPKERGRMARRN